MLLPTFKYRGFEIQYNPKPIPLRTCDWDVSHPDYDLGDDRCWTESSLRRCFESIDDYIEEHQT